MTEATKTNVAQKPAQSSQTERASEDERTAADHAAAAASSILAPKSETKMGRVIALLGREEGASIADLVGETGWQPHTTRAALTGLRKKGHIISSEVVDGIRRYRAVAGR
jgi:hypothetical protein